ncbi:MFS general substrate transporter [Aspergillus indologenus CBS 114.80]|uniref:MFS general substrate transporter n=1 Tax=Aspergillus indologenus CBS 114.80 TaxID=1450541 RepID=A0A2V5IQ50_9EURO|nr:MFS general substrate transporter [Aspergillus indologenus CBS 114.80]
MSLFPQLKLYLNPWGNYEDFKHHAPAQRHDFIISRLENASKRERLCDIVVAGTGFLTDAYCVSELNVKDTAVTDLIDILLALAIATLGGALVGQILFGIAADIWGRRKMYGWELIILIFSTLGMSMASSGKDESMSMIGVLLSWRFFMGGGGLAPTRIRGRMLAVVFLCQSLGEAATAVVALIAVAGFRSSLPDDPKSLKCTGSCVHDLDKIWRYIVGLGAVPAFVAIWFQMTIIESPQYTADVMNNSLQAAADVSQFYRSTELPATSTRTRDDRIISPVVSRDSGSGASENDTKPHANMLKDFRMFLKQNHNLRTLIATSLCWFCLDLPFYGLGLMNAEIINTTCIVVVSSGAIVGSAIAVMTVDRIGRRILQLLGFAWLFVLNVIIGAAFWYLSEHGDASALVVLYVLTQIFFDFAPAELFPTRFRCTCHGISAASGKLGFILAQCFLGYVDFGNASSLSFFMLMGLIVTLWIPKTRDPNGKNKSLEQIAAEMEFKGEFGRDIETNGLHRPGADDL